MPEKSELVPIGQWAAAHGKSSRSARRWASRIEGAVNIHGKGWLVPPEAPMPEDGRAVKGRERRLESAERELAELVRTEDRVTVVQSDPALLGRYATGPRAQRFWYTIDDLAILFAPHVSRHAIVQMLREGEIVGYRRGANGSWIIPRSELVRFTGGRTLE
jgi:hypothetical protein